MAFFTSVFRMGRRERPWVLLISACIFFLLVGAVLYNTVISTVVIKRAGVQYVPFLGAMGAIATLAGSWLGLGPLRRLSAMSQAVFYGILTAVGVSAIGIFYIFLDGAGTAAILAFGALGVTVTSFGAAGVISRLNNAQADVFDVATLQRVDPIMTSVGVAAILISGGLLAAFGEVVPTGAVFAAAAVMISAALPFIVALGLKWNRERGDHVIVLEADESVFSLRPSRLFPREEMVRFVWLLGAIIGLSFFFGRIFGYALTVAANERYATEQGLNVFFGWLTVVGSLMEIAFLNLLQLPLMRRLGLTRSLFVPPLTVLGLAALMTVFPVFWVVVAASLTRQVIINLQGTSFQAMAEGLSDYYRTRAWNWIDGGAGFMSDMASSALIYAVSVFVLPLGVTATVQVMAMLAVVFLGVRLVLTVRMREAYPRLLLSSLAEGDFKTRLRALEAMTEFRFLKDRKIDAVTETVADASQPPSLRLAGIEALAAIKDETALQTLIPLLDSDEPEIRLGAMNALAGFDFGAERLFESGVSRHDLIAGLHRAFERERRPDMISAVLLALVSVRDDALVDFLLRQLSSEVPEVRNSALRAARRFSDPSMIEHVRPLLDDPVAHVRGQALAALWQFKSERAEALESRLADMFKDSASDEDLRQACYLAGTLRLADRSGRLKYLLASRRDGVAIEAAIALLKFDDTSGEPLLRGALASRDGAEAKRVEALRGHHELSEKTKEYVGSLLHAYHLHYPPELPVGEPLRARLADIPRACLERLASEYAAKADESERRKIDQALGAKDRADAPVRGRVRVAGVSEPWRRMAAIALSAAGWLALTAGEDGADMVVSEEGSPDAAKADVLIGSAAAAGAVVRSHVAPSELVRAVESAASRKGLGVVRS